MTLHAVSPALREHTIRVWLESRDLTPERVDHLASLLEPQAADLRLTYLNHLSIELPCVEATSPGKALIVALEAVDAAVNAVCPRLAGSGVGANWRRT